MLKMLWTQVREFVVARRALIIVAAVSVVIGLGIAATYLTVVDKTDTMTFCADACHEMHATVYQEYTHTAHFKNAHGVVVTCADCHIPRNNWLATMTTKMTSGTGDLWHHIVDGDYDLKRFNAKRPRLEKETLAFFAATNARTCKSCHVYANMVLADQNPAARAMHATAIKSDANCLDCHKGIAHNMVAEAATSSPQQGKQGAAATTSPPDGAKIYAKSCGACHAAMQPKLGDKAAWVPLLKKGDAALVASTIHGKGMMPARGGNGTLSDKEIQAAVAYMISRAQ